MLQYWIICIQNSIQNKTFSSIGWPFELSTGRTGVDVLQTDLPAVMVFEMLYLALYYRRFPRMAQMVRIDEIFLFWH